MQKDTIYKNYKQQLADFKFDESVANVFSDMLHRSIPGYDLVLSMIQILTGMYAGENYNYYDLGCSLGAASIAMGKSLRKRHGRIISVDNSEAMIKRCRKNISNAALNVPVNIICDDLQNVLIENAKVVVMNFTLQFIDKDKRAETIKKIYEGLSNGGIFILSEKITFSHQTDKKLNESFYVNFKKFNGYSNLEISQKSIGSGYD